MSNLIAYFQKIPVYGHLLRGSERAYTGFLNKLRVDIFLNFRDKLMKEGFSGEELKAELEGFAKLVNNGTGRGNLGVFETSAPILNGVFFSPRLIASRMNLVNPVFYGKLPSKTRKEALKSLGGMVAVGTTLLSLLAIANGCPDDCEDCKNCFVIETDPRSSYFGKLQFGNITYDPWGGFQQLARTITQLFTGTRKNNKSGEIVELDPNKFPYDTRLTVAGKFLRGKLSPATSLVTDLLAGQKSMGEEVTLGNEVVEKMVPIYLTDTYEIINKEGTGKALSAGLPALFGVGVQYYNPNEFKNLFSNTTEDRLKGLGIESLEDLKRTSLKSLKYQDKNGKSKRLFDNDKVEQLEKVLAEDDSK